MEKIVVKKVYRDQLVTKYGPRTKTSIYAEGHEGKMSTFDKNDIKEGDEVEITIEKNGAFTNFKMGDGVRKGFGGGQTARPSNDHEERIQKLERVVFSFSGTDKVAVKEPEVEMDF